MKARLLAKYPLLRKLYADGGYQGPLFQQALKQVLTSENIEIVKRSDLAKGSSSSCTNGGSWSEPSDGSTDAAVWPKIGSASTARRWPSYA